MVELADAMHLDMNEVGKQSLVQNEVEAGI
jgi:hypothetical protein